MKPDKRKLKRIEATLDHLSPPPNPPVEPPIDSSAPAEPSRAPDRAPNRSPVPKSVQPFPVQQNSPSTPLSKSKPLSVSSPRHAANPHLAIGLLQQIEAIVQRWQAELQQVSQQIHALYAEGPIVDGWLESQPPEAYQTMQTVEQSTGRSTERSTGRSSGQPTGQSNGQPIGAKALRHAEIERLEEYVDAICSTPQPPFTDNQPRSGYRLCGLDADGQLWSRPCPPQQVPYVSLAIARYQKLRTLLAQQQTLENRLMQLVKDLTLLHGQTQDA